MTKRKEGKLYSVSAHNKDFIQVPCGRRYDGLQPYPSFLNQGNLYTINAPQISPYINWGNSMQQKMALADMQNFSLPSPTSYDVALTPHQNSLEQYPTQAPKEKGGRKGIKVDWGTVAALASTPMTIGGQTYKRGLYDLADPLYLASNRKFGNGVKANLEDPSGIGGVAQDVGVGLFQAGAMSGNPLLMAAGTSSKILGDAVNAGWGYAYNDKLIKKMEADSDQKRTLGKAFSEASTNSDLTNLSRNMTGRTNYNPNQIVKGGIFVKDKARRKGMGYINQNILADAYQNHGLTYAAQNIDKKNDELAIGYNTVALGGPIETALNNNDMDVLSYGLMTDYLNTKQRQADSKTNLNSMFTGVPDSMFSFGGDMGTNSSDFPTGLKYIDAGGSHEENVNGGVLMGIDSQGVPNLVEEGETIFDDYVYSNRIECDENTKKSFHIGKKRNITFAQLSKKLEKESSERPNDPISKAALKAQMQMLADHQERQKQEMEARKAKAAFNSLSPEEQVDLMNMAVRQEQQAAMQEQQMAEEQAIQEPSEEELMQQQMPQADGSAAQLGEEVPQFAYGGKVNRFDDGGQAYIRFINSLGFHTQEEFDKWAHDNGIEFSGTWGRGNRILNNDILSKLWKNEKFKEALRKKDAALAHAFSEKGYDWGAYKPSKSNKATIQSIGHGNWKATTGLGWKGSKDLAFIQAVEGLSDDEIAALTTEKLAERMRNTAAYRNTSKWLEDTDNALLYLNTLLNDSDTPEEAKAYARKFVRDGKWKDGFKYDYATVFGSNGKGVRETNPGTYWHSVLEANRENEKANFVINEDGSVERILGDVPKEFLAAGNYAWSDENKDYAYNYFKRPTLKDSDVSSNAPQEDRRVIPIHKNDKLRYAGIIGPVTALGMMGVGIGKPDYRNLDAALSEARKNLALADYKPVGDYLTYRPMDIWSEQNRLNANSQATQRAILNSGIGQGSKIAGLVSTDYNDQIASGELYKKALEYNDAKRTQVADYNRGTNIQNANAYNATSQFNTSAINNHNQYVSSLAAQVAREKMEADASWYNNLYGNIGSLYKGISELGRENAQRNMIADLGAADVFGVLNPDAFASSGMFRYETDEEMQKRLNKTSKAKGGKLRKKKGLTL